MLHVEINTTADTQSINLRLQRAGNGRGARARFVPIDGCCPLFARKFLPNTTAALLSMVHGPWDGFWAGIAV